MSHHRKGSLHGCLHATESRLAVQGEQAFVPSSQKGLPHMGMELVPYTFSSAVLPESTGADLPDNMYQGVHFTMGNTEQKHELLDKIERWFERRDEVILVGHGTTAQGLGFIILEWQECEIDPLFLAILEHDELVEDVSLYVRHDEEV